MSDFYSPLASGEGLTRGDPRLSIRETFMRNHSLPNDRKVSMLQLCGRLVKAWNCFVDGEFPVTSRTLNWKGRFPSFAGDEDKNEE